MGYDVALWKWKPGAERSAAAIYLRLSENLDCPEIAEFDVAAIRREFERNFPQSDWPIEAELQPKAVFFSLPFSGVETIVAWIRRIADEHGLALFDPQIDPILDEDERAVDEESEASRYVPGDFDALLRRARAGDGEAMCEVGNRYSFGEGVTRDASMAFDWYRKSAESGHPSGAFNLAACYRNGEGAQRSLDDAVRWYEKSLELDKNKKDAAFELGEILSKRDPEKALSYYRIAFEDGHPLAYTRIRKLGGSP